MTHGVKKHRKVFQRNLSNLDKLSGNIWGCSRASDTCLCLDVATTAKFCSSWNEAHSTLVVDIGFVEHSSVLLSWNCRYTCCSVMPDVCVQFSGLTFTTVPQPGECNILPVKPCSFSHVFFLNLWCLCHEGTNVAENKCHFNNFFKIFFLQKHKQ